jgi:hypothetical protein
LQSETFKLGSTVILLERGIVGRIWGKSVTYLQQSGGFCFQLWLPTREHFLFDFLRATSSQHETSREIIWNGLVISSFSGPSHKEGGDWRGHQPSPKCPRQTGIEGYFKDALPYLVTHSIWSGFSLYSSGVRHGTAEALPSVFLQWRCRKGR